MIAIFKGFTVGQTAKLFINGRSQAVRLPAAYRFDGNEVFIRQDLATGDVILSRRPANWDTFFAAAEHARAGFPVEFLGADERAQGTHGTPDRDPFDGWQD